MKKNFTVRLSEKRLMKLKKAAKERDKTMTALIEEWIDKLTVSDEGG